MAEDRTLSKKIKAIHAIQGRKQKRKDKPISEKGIQTKRFNSNL